MPATIHKQRVGLLMQESLRLSKVEKRPQELKHLMHRHHEMQEHLKHLLELLTNQKAMMSMYNESRVKVVRHLAIMASTTPISHQVEGDEEGGLKTIYNALKAISTKAEENFGEDLIRKVAEWEKVVAHRVQKEEKRCLGLRRDLTHYETKVKNLHHSIAYTLEKGKEVLQARYDRRDRNDEKLSKAREDYETSMRSLEMYLARVTEFGWRDLVPIIHGLAIWDMKFSDDQASILARLADVVDGLKEIGEEHNFDPSTDCIESLKDKAPEALMAPENLDSNSEGDANSEAPMTPERPAKTYTNETPETQASPASPERTTTPSEARTPSSEKSDDGEETPEDETSEGDVAHTKAEI